MVLGGGPFPGLVHGGHREATGEGEAKALPGDDRLKIRVLAEGAPIASAQPGHGSAATGGTATILSALLGARGEALASGRGGIGAAVAPPARGGEGKNGARGQVRHGRESGGVA
jgi:hypothetical protein